MRRSLLHSGALLLLAPLAAASTALAPSATALASPAADTAQAAETKSVTRHYGDRAVRQDQAGQRIEIRFKAREGDLVMLTEAARSDISPLSARLVGPNGTVKSTDEPWLEVRKTGWQTFSTSSDLGKAAAVQLNKVKLVNIPRNAGPVALEAKRGLVYAAGFAVPDQGLLSGAVSGPGDELLLRPGHRALRPLGEQTLVLGAGLPLAPMQAVADTPAGQRNEKYAAGDVVRLLMRRGEAVAFTPNQVAATADGAAVTIDQSDPRRVTEVVLNGSGWLQTPEAFSTGDAQQTLLLTPSGYAKATPVPGLWKLPSTGPNRLIVFPDAATTTPVSLEVDKVGYRAPLAVGAAATKYTQTVAGQDMIIPITGLAAGALAKVSVTNAALPAGWQAHLINESGTVPNALVTASAAQPVSPAGVGRWIFVPFAPGATGSVDLQALAG
jgi:hypothetical protein